MKSGSVVTATALSSGVVDCINVELSAGNDPNVSDKCQAANVPDAVGRILPVMSDGIYLYSPYLSW